MNYITSKEWWSAAGIRALRTCCQTAVGIVGAGAFISDINWIMCLSAAALSAVLSILTSLAGLPEVKLPSEEE